MKKLSCFFSLKSTINDECSELRLKSNKNNEREKNYSLLHTPSPPPCPHKKSMILPLFNMISDYALVLIFKYPKYQSRNFSSIKFMMLSMFTLTLL